MLNLTVTSVFLESVSTEHATVHLVGEESLVTIVLALMIAGETGVVP